MLLLHFIRKYIIKVSNTNRAAVSPFLPHIYLLRKKMRQPQIAKKLPKDVNLNSVFACNELDLKEVEVYGFDYDYTLACYKPSLNYLLYNLGQNQLIEKYKVRD